MKPIDQPAEIPSAEQAAALESTRHGKKAGVCALVTLGLIGTVLAFSKGGITALVLLIYASPAVLAGTIAGLVFSFRSRREAEIGKANRLGARLGLACAGILLLVLLAAVFSMVFRVPFR